MQHLTLGRVVHVGVPGILRLLAGTVTKVHAHDLADVTVHGVEDGDWDAFQKANCMTTQGSPSALVFNVHLVSDVETGHDLERPPHCLSFCIWPPREVPVPVSPSDNGHAASATPPPAEAQSNTPALDSTPDAEGGETEPTK